MLMTFVSLPAKVICEMATAAMALSVYKRFQAFPCIIQNNPLFFSRKPDPKANTQTKVITAYLDSNEVGSFDHELNGCQELRYIHMIYFSSTSGMSYYSFNCRCLM